MRDSLAKLKTSAKVLPALALLAFLPVDISVRSKVVVNGVVTECSYTDLLGLGIGVLCLFGGAAIVYRGLKPNDVLEQDVAKWHLGVGTVLVGFGILHVLFGVGTVGGPCPA